MGSKKATLGIPSLNPQRCLVVHKFYSKFFSPTVVLAEPEDA